MVDLSVIIVNKDAGRLLQRCLDSLLRDINQSALECEIFVVDNASTDNSLESITGSPYANTVQLIQNTKNTGFAQANNQALQKSTGKFLLLLNPDTIIRKNCLKKTINFLHNTPGAGAVGCKLVYEDGTWQRSYGNFPTISREMIETFVPRYFLRRELFVGIHGYKEQTTVKNVDWISGAFFLARKEAIEQIGLLDESFFMYCEDIDWCKRMRNAGWSVYFFPHAEVVHCIQRTQNTVHSLIDNGSSPYIYYQKHGGTHATTVLWFLTLCKTSLRIIIFSVGSVLFQSNTLSQKVKLNWNTLRYTLINTTKLIQVKMPRS